MCVKYDILATLSYFDIFDYPITQTEIGQFLPNTYPQQELLNGLRELTAQNWIYKFDEFYSLQDNYSLIIKRKQGNIRAREMLKTADKIAAFLSGFPFVKGIAVSGSLSKNCADENSDIDFFIITEKNKLWLARTFMHCFKKIAILFKKEDWFCMNYYVDEDRLQIKEKNIYTAVEVATLLPLRGIKTFHEFFNQNKWSRNFLPNHVLRVSYVQEAKNSFLKKFVEFLFRNIIGNLFNHLFMKLTAYRWAQKTEKRKINKRGIILSMDISKHYAKPSAEGFQKKLLDLYEKKNSNLFRRYENKVKTLF